MDTGDEFEPFAGLFPRAVEIEFQIQRVLLSFASLLSHAEEVMAGGTLSTSTSPMESAGRHKSTYVYLPFNTEQLVSVLDDVQWRIAHVRDLVENTDYRETPEQS